MTSFASRHCWAGPATDASVAGGLPAAPEPYLDLRCHRRLRGPYTGGGALLRGVVPELLERDARLVTARTTEIAAIAPDLLSRMPRQPQTLTDIAGHQERTRFYAAGRTLRLAHGVAELLTDWATICHPGGVAIAWHDLDDADPTDHELVGVLLRRCDPRVVTLIVAASDEALGRVLARYADRVTDPALAAAITQPSVSADPAQLFIDSDGTSRDPAHLRGYEELPPHERARRHTARAQALAALDDSGQRLGAIPYHLERGTDPAGAGADAIFAAHQACFERGFYAATTELALRGRVLCRDDRPDWYWNLTHKIGASLSYLEEGAEAMSYLAELRRESLDLEIHMNGSYQMAMLYTRHLPKQERDDDQALEWINNAIVIADHHPVPRRRIFLGAFMRNAKALIELHKGNLDGALSLVSESIRTMDGEFASDEFRLHRSVLQFNRAKVLAGLGEHAAALADYDEVIRNDPDYGEYYFERAAAHRALGQYAEALADYAASIRHSLPFYEAHFNRAHLLAALGDDDGALQDLDRALTLEPDFVDSLVNRADLLISRGELERAKADIEHGLELDPRNVNLLAAQGSLLAEAGEAEAAYQCYSRVLEQDPGYVVARVNRAVLAHAQGRAEAAVADLNQAIQLSDDPSLRANRAIALHDLGDHQRALADFDVAVATLSDDPDLLYRRGACRYALHDIEGALEDWRAHLAAYESTGTSPYHAEIHLLADGLIAQAAEPESAA